MTKTDKHSTRASGARAAAALLATPLLLLAGCGAAILPTDSNPYNVSYSEWSARWWQWAFAIPADVTPLDDRVQCENGAQGQDGPVWFLAGVFNKSGTARRECNIPAGKAVLFPMVNVECSTLEGDGKTQAELVDCRNKYDFGGAYATIDGVPIDDVKPYYVESGLFQIRLPANNILGVQDLTGKSMAKGYYVMLAPLAAGSTHTLRFGGAFPALDFTTDLTYVLHVAP